MSYNFKNLADVELLSSMPEDASVVVEVNGTTKRAPQVDEMAKLAGVETLTEVPEGATVLAEVDGAIKRVPGDGLGGSSAMVVNFTLDMSNGNITSADKTFEEVETALLNGDNVIGKIVINFSPSENVITEYIPHYYSNPNASAITFYTMVRNEELMIGCFVWSKENGVENIYTSDNFVIINPVDSIAANNGAPVTSGAVYTALQEKQDKITDNIIINSSTSDSTKQFKITVDDAGTITATEVGAPT